MKIVLPPALNAIVPEQVTGKATEFQHSKFCAAETEAQDVFAEACRRLLHPHEWQQYSGKLGADFVGCQPNGQPSGQALQAGDFIRIDIPGPGPGLGKGYDWVMVDAITGDTGTQLNEPGLGIRVRPAANPGTGGAAAHFFDEKASSVFIIYRKELIVTAFYFGRNEVVNNHTGAVADNIRNTVMGLAAKAGISEMQWTALLHGFLK